MIYPSLENNESEYMEVSEEYTLQASDCALNGIIDGDEEDYMGIVQKGLS